MGRVLVLGGSNTDLVCRAPRLPRAGETLNGSSFDVFAGGKGANQAVAAARAGADVAFAGAVGDDDFGQQRLNDLTAEGIDISCVDVIEGATSGVALIAVDTQGENQIIVVQGANGMLRPSALQPAVDNGSWNALLIVLEVPFEVIHDTVSRLKNEAVIIVNAAPYDPRVIDLLPSVDVLVCNEVEAESLLGHPVTVSTALDDATELRHLGSSCAVITLGGHGAATATETDAWMTRAPQVEVVDTTAAGDAFCGVLAAWLANGAELRSAVSAGVAAGSLAVTNHGAQPSLPARSEIFQLLG